MGGTLQLFGDLKFSAGAVKGPGMVDLLSSRLRLSKDSQVIAEALTVAGSGGEIDLNAETHLVDRLTVTGEVTVNGNNNVLDLSGGGEIVVESNSQLHLKDITLHSIEGVNIRCVDDTGSIILDRVNLVLKK